MNFTVIHNWWCKLAKKMDQLKWEPENPKINYNWFMFDQFEIEVIKIG